jgi:serine/threonine-protein kinase RIM15
VDWWALGVILYEFLTGIPPFTAGSVQEIFENIVSNNIEWPDDIDPDAKDLISALLTTDPSTRLGVAGASQVKAHPFFTGISWSTLMQSKPPFIPQSRPDDTSYFDGKRI